MGLLFSFKLVNKIWLVHRTPGAIVDGVAAAPGAVVGGFEAIGNIGGSVFNGLTRPFGK